MAVNEKRRQKKLIKRRNDRKSRKKELVRHSNEGIAARLKHAAHFDIVNCCMSDCIWEEGIGNVLLSRRLPTGEIAFTHFLVDVFCLGVKDVFSKVVTSGQYEEFLKEVFSSIEMVDIEPAYCRKLVEEAVDYAASLDIPPHKDYRKGSKIFGDIDVRDCTEHFEFGKDGKPCFFSGPNDTPTRCRQVISLLTESCGEGNFDFILGVTDLESFGRILGVPADDDWEEEDDD